MVAQQHLDFTSIRRKTFVVSLDVPQGWKVDFVGLEQYKNWEIKMI
ncbi:hypothetical protein V7266_19660 [Neobacillus drentensis]